MPCPPTSASSLTSGSFTSVSSLLTAVKSTDLSFGPALTLSPWAGHHASLGSNFLLSAISFQPSVVLCALLTRPPPTPAQASWFLASPCPQRHLISSLSHRSLTLPQPSFLAPCSWPGSHFPLCPLPGLSLFFSLVIEQLPAPDAVFSENQ